MPNSSFTPLAGCLQSATERQAVMANSVLHLAKSSLNPDPATALAAYTAAEADFDNYTAKTIAAFNNPILGPGSGYVILSPLVQFEVGNSTPVVTNTIGSAYLVDSGGKLRSTVVFSPSLPMQVPGQGIAIYLGLFFTTT